MEKNRARGESGDAEKEGARAAAEGGRLGWEEEAAERNWRRRPRKQMARGRSGERFLGASKGRKAGHVGRGSILSGLEISRRARDLVAGEPPGEGAHVQGNASLPGFLFNFSFWREGPLSSHLRRSSYLLLQ